MNGSETKSTTFQSLVNDAELSLFQKILLATDGTVTDLIALYTGESIRVTKLEQSIRKEEAPAFLQCVEPTRLLHRTILLTGATQNFLFADSVFVFDRFAPNIQDQLLNSDRPIGLLWKEARLETYREIIDRRIESDPTVTQYFAGSAPQLISRTYLIRHHGLPLGAITEKWPISFFR